MAEKKTLEEFIKEYVDRRISDGEIKGIGDYTISRLTKTADRGASDGKLFASLSGGAEYGRGGERLSSLGLSNSGYAQYLSEISERRKSELLKNESVGIDTSDSGYADYLSKYVNRATTLYEKENASDEKKRAEVAREREKYEQLRLSVSDRIVKDEVINYDKAYALALSMGLDSTDAVTVAKEASDKAHEKIRLEVLEKIILNDLSSDKALAYAMSRGLTEDDADILSKAAKEINEDIRYGELSKTYLDYLREQEALKKKEQQEKK